MRNKKFFSGFENILLFIVSIGFSLSPLLLAGLIINFGWREALWILAGVRGIGFSTAAFLFTRDDPESCNLVIDGIDNHLLEKSKNEVINSKTLKDAKRSPVYWIYALSLGMHAMFGTALVFHIVAIFSEVGRGSQEAYNYFSRLLFLVRLLTSVQVG